MTRKAFLTYQKFIEKNEATALMDLLSANKIQFIFEDNSATNIAAFTNNEFDKDFRIKLQKNDFELVDELVMDSLSDQIDKVDKNHYLFEFSEIELLEVLFKRDEWSTFDFLLAQKILKNRGMEANEMMIEALRKSRFEELARPDKNQKYWIIIGYISSFLGGLIGIFIGWHMHNHKRTLPNGDRVYGYSVSDRKHGIRIFVVGIIFFIIWIFLRILFKD